MSPFSTQNFPWHETLCMGAAGNVAGHMEQAGEALVGEKRANGPKGLFPVYVPGHPDFLGQFPGSKDTLRIPPKGDFQIEPELGLLGEIEYNEQGKISKLIPKAMCAYNDLTHRDTSIPLFSLKKNWGVQTKGYGPIFELEEPFMKGSLKEWRIACWHRRGRNWYEYAVDTKVEAYSYFYEELLQWTLHRVSQGVHQDGFENIAELLNQTNQKPKYFAMGCGATCYTEWGSYVYLKPGDASAVIVYQGELLSASEILGHLAMGSPLPCKASVLIQDVLPN